MNDGDREEEGEVGEELGGSFWQPYLDSLPPLLHTTHFFSDDELEELQASMVTVATVVVSRFDLYPWQPKIWQHWSCLVVVCVCVCVCVLVHVCVCVYYVGFECRRGNVGDRRYVYSRVLYRIFLPGGEIRFTYIRISQHV